MTEATESLMYSSYIILEERQSTIDPEATITVDVGMRCPRCKHEQKIMEHAETRECPSCGLSMQRFGNVLECRK